MGLELGLPWDTQDAPRCLQQTLLASLVLMLSQQTAQQAPYRHKRQPWHTQVSAKHSEPLEGIELGVRVWQHSTCKGMLTGTGGSSGTGVFCRRRLGM